ncbi:hypothetical protein SAMN05444678_102254 [Sphingomonas sp. YR710]|uniref:hypothetical protein n=1 Tax=Sphingomonas sp. YR710 TaxID=1882773 RepID=UPI00088B0B63|nr:hypothetical protein [Sphingomonas sp. YR710]SDC30585.1 hypothetical protein SAMN05444678_102254 [Sphingomonas sp. YR710]
MADVILDLLGDPIPPEHVGRGRPPHVPTEKNRMKIMLLLALGNTEDDVAAAIGITAKTLRKHYSRQLKERASARLRLDGELLASLAAAAAKENVGAIKELYKRLDKHEMVQLADKVADRGRAVAPPPKLGKKEEARITAGNVTGKFAPPPAPRLIN